ncbi:MAG TPA: hypothetical protein PKE05_12115, partial [Microthrixaceae bacterium]|nr:hypothetical protein [Microthrixaceae bacterium]
MALTEKSRSALYLGLSHVIDEEAVEEMLSYFPARDVEESVTKEFLRAELAELEMRLSESLRSELHSEVGALRGEVQELRGEFRSELQSEVGSLRSELQSEVGSLRSEMRAMRSELRDEMRRTVLINIGTLVAFAAVI